MPTEGYYGQAVSFSLRSLLAVISLAWIPFGPLLQFPSNSYAGTSSVHLQASSVQALPPSSSNIEITSPKNGSTTTNPYPILRASTDARYNYV